MLIPNRNNMANVDLGRYKRIVQYFWDPEPKNDEDSQSPIWCLGCQYAPSTQPIRSARSSPGRSSLSRGDGHGTLKDSAEPTLTNGIDDGLAYAETPLSPEQEKGWPPAFLDDFESRIWMSYRSGFPAIAQSHHPKSSSAMTLAVRIRSQLMEKDGFTADTGFGCMIRSGQALLANALIILRLGRGMFDGDE